MSAEEAEGMQSGSEDHEYVLEGRHEDTAYVEDGVMGEVEGQEAENPSNPADFTDTITGDQEGSDTEEMIFRTLSNFTHAAIGQPNVPLPCLPLAAKKNRLSWLKDLSSEGYAALLFVDMKALADQPGFSSEWWFKNRSTLRRRLVKTPLESVPSAGIFTMKERFPSGSLVNSVICIVSELVASEKAVPYCTSTAQLFLPSSGGFSQDFRTDERLDSSDEALYRCFWYLTPDKEAKGQFATTPDREGLFIGSAGANTKEFGGIKVITMAAFYGEAERKFRLHPGDILVMDGRFSVVVDLPIGGRAESCRVLSWVIMPKGNHKILPVMLPDTEIVMSIEQIIADNEEARTHYEEEMDCFEISPGSIGDPETFMQRLRVTPKSYSVREIKKEVERNADILYVDNEYFGQMEE